MFHVNFDDYAFSYEQILLLLFISQHFVLLLDNEIRAGSEQPPEGVFGTVEFSTASGTVRESQSPYR